MVGKSISIHNQSDANQFLTAACNVAAATIFVSFVFPHCIEIISKNKAKLTHVQCSIKHMQLLWMRNFDVSIIVPCDSINRNFIELISFFLIKKKIEFK